MRNVHLLPLLMEKRELLAPVADPFTWTHPATISVRLPVWHIVLQGNVGISHDFRFPVGHETHGTSHLTPPAYLRFLSPLHPRRAPLA